MIRSQRQLLNALLLCFLMSGSLAFASGSNALLGSHGELYTLVQGSYGELFPEGSETDPTNSVLALAINWPDDEAELLLVPGTGDSAVESVPSLALEHASDSLFVVWEATRTIHSELFIIGRNPDGWSEVEELSGRPFNKKSNPRLATTHERFKTTLEDGTPEEQFQTILHLTWWDESNVGGSLLYTPLLVTDEGLIRDSPIALDEFIDSELPEVEQHPNELFARSPYIQSGRDNSHVLVAFVDPTSGRLVTLSIAVSGSTLDSLADKARAQVIIFGLQGGSQEELAAAVGSHLSLEAAAVVDQTLADYLGEQASDSVLESPADWSLESIAEKARAQVIIFGSNIGGGFQNAAGEARAQVIIFGDTHPGIPHGRSMVVEMIGDRSVPESLPENAEARIMISPDGRDMIVSWTEEGKVHYVETQDDQWAEERTLQWSDETSLDLAFAILQRRISS